MTENVFKVCPFPFANIEIVQDGRIFTCCPDWLKPGMHLGGIGSGASLEDIFNGRKAREFRAELRRGNYGDTCSENCPKLQDYRKRGFFTQPGWSPISDDLVRKINRGRDLDGFIFENVSMAADPRCNLRCVMCRDEPVVDLPRESIGAAVALEALEPYLGRIREIKLCGDGEPFFIPEVREFLFGFPQEKYPDLGFALLTNGLLLTREALERVSHLTIHSIIVSMDGATKEVYEAIRRNGRWERLMENLEALSEKYRKGEIGCFTITMTVMRENIDDMMDFYRLGKRFGCPYVTFQRMFGGIHENIFEPGEPGALLKLREVLRRPEMSSGYVNLAGIAGLRNYRAPAGYRARGILRTLKRMALHRRFSATG